ncbi:MAG TPA: hypothetical protein VFL99_12010 [Segeticoccus sp.]|uniref:hypothetical protein n=1 Tax=Segeticoccus sp. TaxID=2706531 RepID=UPI002D8091B4|nr:hypothetical protein [Segeticoccus sp.]HET8601043.1 hypothetical protein [Segeticoccus sp.]
MGFWDRLFGRGDTGSQRQESVPAATGGEGLSDGQAIERYQYLLRTAPPEKIEQAHEQAFARLTPEQRQEVLRRLSQDLPEAERPQDDSPRSLARSTTRMEVLNPGSIRRTFGGGFGMGPGLGMGIGSMLLSSMAGAFVGSAIAQELFADDPGAGFGDGTGQGNEGQGADGQGNDGQGGDGQGADGQGNDGQADPGTDGSGGDVQAAGYDGGYEDGGYGGYDGGGDYSGGGADYGGGGGYGDLGGGGFGDFGGGDFGSDV